MSDFVWVLKHPSSKLTKTWKLDGTIEQYSDPKQFIGTEVKVSNVHDLSRLLTRLETDTNACVIRGKYKGSEHSALAEPDDHQKNRVLRRKSVHDDIPHHWILVDIDSYEPFDYDPMLEPVESINEFITLMLPNCFHGAAYHWQLSSSAGHTSKGLSKLKAHVWFWLATPYTSAQLRTWATATGYRADKALLDTIQVHYTATPLFEEGVINPITHRSGFEPGEFGDEVGLVISDDILTSAPANGAPLSRHQKLIEVLSGDPIVDLLVDQGRVKSKRSDGGLNIICPMSDNHTGDSTESATIYYTAFTGGHKHGAFVCLHDHCRGMPQSLFLDALGYDDAADVFSALADEVRERVVPEAKHLCTDQANAGRIMDHFKGKILVSADRWFAWDGTRWKPDDGDALAKGMNLSKIINKEADVWKGKKSKSTDEKNSNLKIAEALISWSKKSEMANTINAAMSMAKKVISVDTDRLDSHHWHLNCANGTVDLRTGILQPHNPEDLITKLCPVNYNPAARCDMFLLVLARVTREDDKAYKPLLKFLLRWFGYCCTGSTREQKFLVHYGNGRNGKSTVLDAIAEVMGDYSGTAAPGLMISSDKGRHPTEIADLFGRRMVTAHETGENGALREDFIKQATGSDRLKARYMAKDFFEFIPTHKLQLLTNHKPTVKGQDEGIWRRVCLVPYAARFGSAEEVASGFATHLRDTTTAERLLGEKEGILRLLVEGAVEWFREGLNPPDSVLAATKKYQSSEDRIYQFTNELCEVDDENKCYLTNGEHSGIYATYTRWCKSGGIHPLSKLNFLAGIERVVPRFRQESVLISDGGRRRKVTVIHGLSCPEYYEM